jgi:hypothetical protein
MNTHCPRNRLPLSKWFRLKWFRLSLAFKRAEDDKLMKFQRAAEFMRVPPDLTTATLYKYKYMVLHLLFPLHSWHCYVHTESNTLCARGIGWKRLLKGTAGIPAELCQISSGHLNEATWVSGWTLQYTSPKSQSWGCHSPLASLVPLNPSPVTVYNKVLASCVVMWLFLAHCCMLLLEICCAICTEPYCVN